MIQHTRSAVETRNALESEYSDAHKAANGVRPRFSLSHLSDAELDREITAFYAEAAADNPTHGDGWTLYDREAEDRFDDFNDFGGSFFGMTYDEAPGCGEDY